MNLTLNLSSSEELPKEKLQALTEGLCKSINKETDMQAEISSGAVAEGHKGEPITLGLITLTFLKSGAAVALFETLKAYFNLEPSLVIKIVRPDGTIFEFSAKNMTPEEVQAFLSQLNNLPH